MADDLTIAVGVSSAAGVLTLLNVGWNLFRSLGADGREAVKTRLDSHASELDAQDKRIAILERDEAEERGHGIVARLASLETKCHQFESGLQGIRSEMRSSDDKLEQVLSGIESIREELQDD